MEMTNESGPGGWSLSCTVTLKVHGTPLLVHAPLNVAVLPLIVKVLKVRLWTFAPLAWFTYCRSPPIGPVLDCACTMKPKFAKPPLTSTVPPPVTLPTVGPGGRVILAILATKASWFPPAKVVWKAPGVVGKLLDRVKPNT